MLATLVTASMPSPANGMFVLELDGELMVESSRPTAVFETTLPIRWYLPRDDVPAWTSSTVRTLSRNARSRVSHGSIPRESVASCTAMFLDLSRPDSGEPPHRRTRRLLQSRVDLIVDGERQRRPFTPWSLDVRA